MVFPVNLYSRPRPEARTPCQEMPRRGFRIDSLNIYKDRKEEECTWLYVHVFFEMQDLTISDAKRVR